VGRVQSGVPRVWSHLYRLHQRVYDDVPASVQLPVEGQAHGVHPGNYLERTDGQCQAASVTAWSVVSITITIIIFFWPTSTKRQA